MTTTTTPSPEALAFMKKYNPTIIENHGIRDADIVLHLHNEENGKDYTVMRIIRRYWMCTCDDHYHKRHACKHVHGIIDYVMS